MLGSKLPIKGGIAHAESDKGSAAHVHGPHERRTNITQKTREYLTKAARKAHEISTQHAQQPQQTRQPQQTQQAHSAQYTQEV